MNIDTKCPHERNPQLRSDIRYPDYEPLTRSDLDNLLNFAITGPRKNLSKIQVRLNRAIPGMTCPRPIEGAVAAKMSRLDQLYVTTKPKDLPGKAGEFWKIING